jgi:hypothetical protein
MPNVFFNASEHIFHTYCIAHQDEEGHYTEIRVLTTHITDVEAKV